MFNNKIITFIICIILPSTTFAVGHSNNHSDLLLWLAIITTVAIFARASDKIGQPLVLGQLLVGMLIGILAHYKILNFENMVHSEALNFFAILGSIFLLLEIGLESSLTEIVSSGKHAITVALIGVIIPFLCGCFIVSPFILKTQDLNIAIFMGSMLAVTSTGISISVFKDLKILKNEACQIVLAASIIDDILGLILLSITTNLAIEGNINKQHIILTIVYVAGFFALSILFGKHILPRTINILAKINNNADSIILIIMSFCLSLSYVAGKIGLAFIIGAFVAGILLHPSLFKAFKNSNNIMISQSDTHLYNLISPYGKIFTPLFFIYAGMQVDIITYLHVKTLLIASLISIIAILSKLSCGIFLPKRINKLIVGFGMSPRGEIGLIFAITGLQLKIINDEIFAILLLMIIFTSIIAPIALNKFARLKR